ncbi:MAG TPA: murein biosynthesis integral membrane protein MurJ [Planctomycetota bacterium]|nr:murein biosynthesis integral membrane protein MurJ [Planctomycetota bacterium]
MGKSSFVRSAGVVSACTLLSRLLGFVRDMLCARYFGASMVWDAFSVAFRIPNLFRRLFGEGALTAAFLPAFVERYESGRPEEAHALLNRLVTALGLFLGIFAAAGIGITYLLPQDPKTALMAPLLRTMLPYLPLICVAAILGAALNAMRHYFTPAFAPVVLNVVLISALAPAWRSIQTQAAAVVLGGLATVLVLLPALASRRVPIRPRTGFGDAGLREVGRKFLPVVFGLAPVQLNELAGSMIAQYCVPGTGAASTLYYGNQLTQLPLALIGTAVATVVFPLFASPKEDFKDVFQRSLRFVLFLSVPASIGLMVLARPIVSLVFQHGPLFGVPETDRTAWVTFFYSAGLWCYCANQIQVRAFYAKKDTMTPVKVSAAMVALNLGLTLGLVGPLGERGISIANSATGLASFLVLNVLLRKRHGGGGGIDLRPVTFGFAQSLLAGGVMGLAAWGVYHLLGGGLGDTISRKLVLALVPIASGAAVYLALARLLRMDEARMLLRRRHDDHPVPAADPADLPRARQETGPR